MGYDSGKLSGRGSGKKYSTDSFRIGKCNGGNNWGKCKGGCNDYEVGVACNNNKYAKCDKNQGVKITIACSGGRGALMGITTSCTGSLV